MQKIIDRYILYLISIIIILFAVIYHTVSYSGFKIKNDIFRKPCVATGVVVDIGIKKEKYRYELKNVRLRLENEEIKAKRIVAIGDYNQNVRYGAKIELKGLLNSYSENRNFGEFNSKLYNFNHDIYYEIKDCQIIGTSRSYNHILEGIYQIRAGILSGLSRADSSNEKINSKFIGAILLSEKSELSYDVKALYQRNGISHILSISGLHIYLIGYGIYTILRKIFDEKISVFLSIIAISFYMLLIGFGVSSFRAYIMLFILLAGRVIKRTYSISRSLFIALIITLCINPKLLFDSSFILSYGAVFSIITIMPIIKEVFNNKLLINQGVLLTFSIQLGLMPVVAYLFYEQPLYSIFLNVVIVPLLLPLLIFGALACCFSLFSIKITAILLNLSGIIISLFTKLCEIADILPFSRIVFGRPSIIKIMIYYLILLLALFYVKYFRYKKRALIFATIVLTALLMLHIRTRLEITVLDVGQGDGIVIELPFSNKVCMIDGGSTSRMDGAAGAIQGFLKAKGHSKIDIHILTHSDKDHVLGIENMINASFAVKRVILPDIAVKDNNYLFYESLLKQKNIKTDYIKSGDFMKLGDVFLYCLHPEKSYIAASANEYSTVLHLSYKDFDMLLTGDLEEVGEAKLIKKELPEIDVLKVAHHGSRFSSCDEFLDKTKPRLAIISCGLNNSYGHPHKDTLDRLKSRNIKTYRTDKNGAVSLKTDGISVSINSIFK